MHPVTLSFSSPELQREFRGEHTRRSLKLARRSLLLAAFLFMAFGALDTVLFPEQFKTVLFIRISTSVFLVAVTLLTFTEFVKQYYQAVMAAVVLVAGGSILLLIFLTETFGGYHYYAALILAFIYAHSLLRLRFIHAALTTWLLFFVYEIVAFSLEVTPFEILVNNTFFLFSANVLGMFASYGLEYYMRTVFWQTKLIGEEQSKLMHEHERKTKELEAARRIQLAMLPKRVPAHPLVDICTAMKTAVEIGGDYYDFHVHEDNTITFALGDATGHGAQAGVMVTATKMLFSNFADRDNIVEIVKRASLAIKRMGLPRLFMAMAIGRLRNNRLEIVGAGLPPALLYRAATGTVERIPLKGMPLGSFADYPYRKQSVDISAGDAVLFMTDGFPELRNDRDEIIGYDRVAEIFASAAGEDPAVIIEHLNAYMHTWLGGMPQQDDTTFIVMKLRTETDKAGGGGR
jgi:hypothetical protein